jgi:hypothetical protein
LLKQVEKQKQEALQKREAEILDFKKNLKMIDENKKKEDLLKAKKMEASLKIGADMISQLKKITEQREVEEKKAKEDGIRERERLE